MARAHELLAQERWMGADVGTIIAQESVNFDAADAIRSSGPRIRLNPKAALSFALAAHELGTNALKYGALSAPDGHVAIRWRLAADPGSGNERFHLSWTESGGPLVNEPERRGFGSRLIETALAGELTARAELAFLPGGLSFTLDADAAALVAGPAVEEEPAA
jgi:two-component sensor histidine kinase